MAALRLRPFTLDDADEAFELAERYSQAAFGHSTFFSPDVLRNALTGPDVVPDLDAMVVEEDEAMLAAAIVFARAPYSEIPMGLVLEPGLDPDVLRECLGLISDRFDDAVRPRLGQPGIAANPRQSIDVSQTLSDVGDVLRDLGFTADRQVYSMQIDLPPGRSDVPCPEGFSWRAPSVDDLDVDVITDIFERAFADHPGDTLNAQTIRHELELPTMVLPLSLIASDDVGPVAVLLTLVEDIGGYIAGLGVLSRARRRGLGSAMLRHAFAGLSARGVTACRLHVEAVNPSAVALYEQVGMTAESVSDVWLRPARR